MGTVLGLAAVLAACSSSENGAGGEDGGTGAGGSGGGGPSPCDHVIVADQDLMFGFGAALAADHGDVFVLRDAGTRRNVQALKSGSLMDVAGLDNEATVYMGGSTLIANSSGFFFDATVGGVRGIYGAPRSGGTASLLALLSPDSGSLAPPFVADDASFYTKGLAPSEDAFARIARGIDSGAGAAVVGSGAFGGATSYALAVAGDTLFTISGTAEVRASAKTPAGADGGVAMTRVAVFNLPACSADLGSTVAASSSGLFIGCVAADLSGHTIYRVPLPDAWPDASAASDAAATGSATEVISGNSINTTAFLLHGSDLYYGNEADPALFRMPQSGGAKVKIMATHGAKRMIATATDIYVLSACGLQQAPL
jgi:hypothetical protein